MRNRHEIATHDATPLRAPERLRLYRSKAAHLDTLAAHSGVAAATGCNPHTWQSCRYSATPAGAASTAGAWQRIEDKGRAVACEREYYTDTVPPGWRVVGNASDIVSRLARGWYSDSHQSEMYIAAVLQLPARHGAAQFVPAIYETFADGITSWPLDRYATKEDCARAADGYAECAAEREREYRLKDDCERRIEELREEIAAARTRHSAICDDLRHARNDTPALCAAVRDTLQRLRGSVREHVADIRKLIAEPWSIAE
jgi:hypothetical protein